MDQKKLIKLLQLTQSTNDNEALAAIRKANSLLDKAGHNWESCFETTGKIEATSSYTVSFFFNGRPVTFSGGGPAEDPKA